MGEHKHDDPAKTFIRSISCGYCGETRRYTYVMESEIADLRAKLEQADRLLREIDDRFYEENYDPSPQIGVMVRAIATALNSGTSEGRDG